MKKTVVSCYFAVVLLLLYQTSFCMPQTLRRVNVLSWWGYLDPPEIKKLVNDRCGVTLSVDEYYSNQEFLRRWAKHRQSYDIAIFSDTIYDIVKPGMARDQSTLWKASNDYVSTIRKHYINQHYPHNIVYYVHSLTGFLWNPKNVNLSSRDTVYDIFSKAKGNYVILMDDATEVSKMIMLGLADVNNSKRVFDIDDFYKVTKGKNKIYITSEYNSIYKQPDFAFAFTWSGAALVILDEAKKRYNFLIHPKLSYISTDLLAELNNNLETICVAKTLSSKTGVALQQNQSFYFTPYGEIGEITNSVFLVMYKDFLSQLPFLSWIDSVSLKEFNDISKTWTKIRLDVMNKV